MTKRREYEEREVSMALDRERQGSGNFPREHKTNNGVCNCIDPSLCFTSAKIMLHGMTDAQKEQLERMIEKAKQHPVDIALLRKGQS